MCTIIKIISCMVPFWDIKGKGQSFFVILGHFLLFDPPNNPKNQDFEKKLKKPGDIIILHVCTTNDYHMMYHSWDIKHNRQNYLSFWAIFCHFTPLTTQRIKILKKYKKTGDVIILHKSTINDNHTVYGSKDKKCNWHNFFVILGHFLPIYPQNIKKTWKKHLEISSKLWS